MLSQLLRFIHLLEDTLLITLLVSMMVLASGQIILRNFFDQGFLWIDPLLRVLVLWSGMMGAIVASRFNKHIRIDLISSLFNPHIHLLIQAVVGLITVAVCTLIAWYGARWVYLDFVDGIRAFSGLPAWILEIIIPITFSLIALRYLLHSIHWFYRFVRFDPQENDAP